MDQNKDKEMTERLEKAFVANREKNIGDPLPWKAWGSWFSWGSPVGMGLGWALFIIPLGYFLLLLHMAGILH